MQLKNYVNTNTAMQKDELHIFREIQKGKSKAICSNQT